MMRRTPEWERFEKERMRTPPDHQRALDMFEEMYVFVRQVSSMPSGWDRFRLADKIRYARALNRKKTPDQPRDSSGQSAA